MSRTQHAYDWAKHPWFVGKTAGGVFVYPGSITVSSLGRDFTQIVPKIGGSDAVNPLYDTAAPTLLSGTEGVVYLKLGKFVDNYNEAEVLFEAELPDDDDDFSYLLLAEVTSTVVKQVQKSDLVFFHRPRPKLYFSSSVTGEGQIKVEDGLVLATEWNFSATDSFPTTIYKRHTVTGNTFSVAEGQTIWLHAVFTESELMFEGDLVQPIIYTVSGGHGGQGGLGGSGGRGGLGGDGGSGGIGGSGGWGGSGGRGGDGGSGGDGGIGGQGGRGGDGGLGGQGGSCPGGSGSGECDCPGAEGEPGHVGYPGYEGLLGSAGSSGGPGGAGQPGYPGLSGEPGGLGYAGGSGQSGYDGYAGESGYSGEPGSTASIPVFQKYIGRLRVWTLSTATLEVQTSAGSEDRTNAWVPILKRLTGDDVRIEQYVEGAPITMAGHHIFLFNG